MSGLKIFQILREYKEALPRASTAGLSMQLRLFMFFFLFLATVMLGVLIILLAAGIFRSGAKESRNLLANELAHISQDVSSQYGGISVQAVDLAKVLSRGFERQMKEHGVEPGRLREHPELLEHFLEEELATLTGVLEKTKSSGVFLILDATVNPALEGAEHSRAGLYLKNMEPNIVNASFADLRFLRGPATVARESGITMLPQWEMEFQVKGADYYEIVMQKAQGSKLPLSRLYNWSHGVTLPDSSERAMLCSVPLVDSQGNVFGVCGLEVSAMLFKLSYTPDNSLYNNLFCMFSPVTPDGLRVTAALFAGSYPAFPSNMTDEPMTMRIDEQGFCHYEQTGSLSYAGLSQEIALYPEDSAYHDERWLLSLMMPQQDILQAISGQNRRLLLLLALLMLFSIAASLVISRKYIRPVTEALNCIKMSGPAATPKTKIPEIDDLLDFLSAQDAVTGTLSDTAAPVVQRDHSPLFDQFVKNIETLSVAERAVFNLYLQGHTAKEITDILCLSINTIKTHNKRIYMKLNVTSRKELMVYIQMMEEAKSSK